MSDKERLDDLLFRWEQMFEQGQDVPPEELCRDCPEMIPSVRQSTEDLKRMDWLKRAGGEGETISLRPRHVHTPTSVGVPRLIAGQYRLDELLGEGGFGQVWRGVDLKLKRPVAVKVPKSGRSTRPGGAEAFLAEAQKVARLEHPGIVPVHAVAQHGSAWFIVSKLIEGTDLRRRLADGRVPVREAVRIVVAVAEALTYAHERNIVHRDIKPSNLLVDHQGGVYVTDFGIALDLDESSPTDIQAAGTLGYMAPEQFLGDSGVIDARTDIYGLGVVLYEMLTGLLPFPSATLQAVRDAAVNAEPPPPRTLDDGVPKEIQRICLKCLAKTPEGRYQTAQALIDDLVGWLNPRKRHYLLMGAVVASCLFASILAAVWFPKGRSPSDETSWADENEVLPHLRPVVAPAHIPATGVDVSYIDNELPLPPVVAPPPGGEKRPLIQAKNLDVETFFAAPKNYRSGMIEFDGVRLHGAMKPSDRHDNTHLTVETRRGLLVAAPALRNQGYSFYAPAELAVRLREHFDPKTKYAAKIRCQLTIGTRDGNSFWRGRVIAVSLYGKDDKIQRTITCDADMVNAEPEKSVGKMFVFDGLLLAGGIGEGGGPRGHCTLTLRTEKGTSLDRVKDGDKYSGLSCYVSAIVGNQLRRRLDPTKQYRVRLTCKVEQYRREVDDGLFCRGKVSVVTLLEENGSEGRTFRDMD